MKLVPSPGRHEDAWHDEIEAALHGQDDSAAGQAWRELGADVRALVPPMGADFERLLADRVAEWTAGPPDREASPERRSPRRHFKRLRLPSERLRLPSGHLRLPSGHLRLPSPGRLRAAGLLVTVVCTLAVAGLIAASLQPSGQSARNEPRPASAGPATGRRRADQLGPATPAAPATAGKASASTSGGVSKAARAEAAASAPAGSEDALSAPGHVQQLAASVTLSASRGEVQSLADRVARLAVSDGGFVQSSQVQQQAQGPSEATLDLKVPSAELSAALAALGRLAPIRAENQSSQDITSEYDAARRNLADAVAERKALLQALARAVTQAQVESLRQQISLAAEAITRDQSALRAVSQQASSSALEVTVVGDATHAEGLTLQRGLHDAGRVLTVALVVLLIGAAVLVPLAIVCVVLLAGARAWRHHLRERALA
jgi:hypothetical protein